MAVQGFAGLLFVPKHTQRPLVLPGCTCIISWHVLCLELHTGGGNLSSECAGGDDFLWLSFLGEVFAVSCLTLNTTL